MSVVRASCRQGVCPIAPLTDLQHHAAPAPSEMLRCPATKTPAAIAVAADITDARNP